MFVTEVKDGVAILRMAHGKVNAIDLRRFLVLTEPEAVDFFRALDRLWQSLLNVSKPVVAAINGHALAGGCVLAACCDYRLLANGTARLGVPELSVGVPFPALAWEVTAARVAPAAHRALVFLGAIYLPKDAIHAGLTEEVCEPDLLMTRAIEVARRLADIPSESFALSKAMANRPVLDRAKAAADLDANVARTWLSDGVRRSIAEYLQKLKTS